MKIGLLTMPAIGIKNKTNKTNDESSDYNEVMMQANIKHMEQQIKTLKIQVEGIMKLLEKIATS